MCRAPQCLDGPTNVMNLLNTYLITAQPAFEWFYYTFLLPLGQWAGETLIQELDRANQKLKWLGDWIASHKEEVNLFTKLFLMFGAAALFVAGTIAAVSAAATILTAVLTILTSPAGVVILLIALFSALFVKTGKAEEALKYLQAAFADLGQFVKSVFAGDFESAFKAIGRAAKNIFNLVILAIEDLINIGIEGLNKMIREAAAVPIIGKAIQALGTPQIGHITIPRLAKGGVIDQPTLALMGEYGGAKSNPEIAAPQSVLLDTMAMALAPLIEALREGASGRQQELHLHFEGTMADLVRMLRPALDAEARRQGVKLIIEGSGT